MGLRDYTVYQMLGRGSKIYGDRVALSFGDHKLTYREMQNKINSLASGLVNQGIEKGDRIGVLAKNCLEYVYLYGASAKLGAIMIPLNWRFQIDEMEYIISDATPKMLFVGKEFRDAGSSLISKFDFIHSCYTLDGSEKSFEDFSELLFAPRSDIEPDVCDEDPYVIIYTAAITGNPRGAVISHKNMIASSIQCVHHWQLTKNDCNLGILPLYHMFGLLMLLNVMHVGGKNIILSDFDTELSLSSIQKHEATIFAEFPPILSRLLETNKDLKYDLSSLRIVAGLESPDTIRQLEETTKAVFWALYGQTETSGPDIEVYDRGGYCEQTIDWLQNQGVSKIGIQPKGKKPWLVDDKDQIKKARARTEGDIGSLKSAKYGFNLPKERKWPNLQASGVTCVLSQNLNRLMRDLTQKNARLAAVLS